MRRNLKKKVTIGHWSHDARHREEKLEYYKTHGFDYIAKRLLSQKKNKRCSFDPIFYYDKHIPDQCNGWHGKYWLYKPAPYWNRNKHWNFFRRLHLALITNDCYDGFFFAGEVENNFNPDAAKAIQQDNFIICTKLVNIKKTKELYKLSDVIIAGTCNPEICEKFKTKFKKSMVQLAAKQKLDRSYALSK